MEKKTNYDEICKPIVDNKVFPYLFETDGSDFLANKRQMNETEYITSLLVLRFDDDIGQIAEQVWPPDSLDKNTIKQMSSLGFPETNSLKQDGEMEYVFKVRQNNHIPLKCTSITDQKFYYCYTLFIQMKRSDYKRGYLQKSLVIVSQFYFKKLFSFLLSQLKSALFGDSLKENLDTNFKTSLNRLERIYEMFITGIEKHLRIEKKDSLEILDLQHTDQNPFSIAERVIDNENKKSEDFFENSPVKNFHENIKFKEPNLHKNKPEHSSLEISAPKSSSKSITKSKSESSLESLHLDTDNNFSIYLKLSMEISVFPQNNNFVEYLSFYYICRVWNLWELVITETPMIIQTDTPNICQEVVFLLSSLIFPLEYMGDLRPYFTIYDTDFKDYKEDPMLKNSNSSIVGVINPICTRMLKDWVVVHFDDLFFAQLKTENPTKIVKKEYMDEEVASLSNCKRKFILSQNKILLKTIYELIENSDYKSLDKINIYLRMYLIELNNDFMRTFEEYFFSDQFTRIKRLTLIKPNFSIFEIFDKNNFIRYLSTSEIYFNTKYVKDKKKTVELYTSFIQTKGFNNYLKNLM